MSEVSDHLHEMFTISEGSFKLGQQAMVQLLFAKIRKSGPLLTLTALADAYSEQVKTPDPNVNWFLKQGVIDHFYHDAMVHLTRRSDDKSA